MILQPFLPDTTEKLAGSSVSTNPDWKQAGKTNLLAAGHMIGKPELLFPKIEDEQIEKQLDKLDGQQRQCRMNPAGNVEPAKETMSFEDFTAMDIRVATILDAEKVAKTRNC